MLYFQDEMKYRNHCSSDLSDRKHRLGLRVHTSDCSLHCALSINCVVINWVKGVVPTSLLVWMKYDVFCCCCCCCCRCLNSSAVTIQRRWRGCIGRDHFQKHLKVNCSTDGIYWFYHCNCLFVKCILTVRFLNHRVFFLIFSVLMLLFEGLERHLAC